jgi:hypothetical protein
MVKLAFPSTALILAATALTPACAAPPSEARPAVGEPPSTDAPAGKAVTDTRLPINRRFPDLDAYLAHLRRQSHMDGAWYREVRPGLYELQTGNLRRLDGGADKRTFTREELEKKFGFSR